MPVNFDATIITKSITGARGDVLTDNELKTGSIVRIDGFQQTPSERYEITVRGTIASSFIVTNDGRKNRFIRLIDGTRIREDAEQD